MADLNRYTKKIRETVEATDDAIDQIRRDRSLHPQQRAHMIDEIQGEFRLEYARLHRSAANQLDADKQVAFERAYPVEKPPADLAGELRLARLRDEALAEWEARGDGPTLQEYENALRSGDAERVRIMEKFGPGRITNPDMKAQFTRRVELVAEERMPDEQRQARQEFEELENKTTLELGLALRFHDDTAKRISDTPAEQLANSQPPAPREPSQPSVYPAQ